MSEQRDAVAAASYAYDEALMDYEEALCSRGGDRAGAEAALSEAAGVLSRAQSALVLSRQTATPVTFTTLLSDPTQQFDPGGEVMRSVLAYQNATKNTPSADDFPTTEGAGA